MDSGLQLGTIQIQPVNSKPYAPNITITVWAGETYTGYFNGTYDPDALDPLGDFCEAPFSWCLNDYEIVT